MNYISTRGRAPALAFDDVLLTGLARDGGLYVPETWPQFSADEIASWKDLSYAELAFQVIKPCIGGSIADADLKRILDQAYAAFDTPEVAPLRPLSNAWGDDAWMLELFHGPTLAFKDMAMQFLGRAFDHVLGQRGERVCIVSATSGDTGSAAIEACRDRDAIDVFILYPDGRVSDVQRRQMTTVQSANVHTLAVDGSFDDCQDLVKAAFNDIAFRDRTRMSAVNSINWARIVAQIVYYFWAALKVGAPERPVAFTVPTGNFGNVFAGYAAARMGLDIAQLIIGSNSNDILTRFFETGAMQIGEVAPTISPSMDIQVSSNFERLLFELLERDGEAVNETLTRFRESGRFEVSAEVLAKATSLFDAARFDDEQTRAAIAEAHREFGQLIDPHTAVALAAAKAKRRDANIPMVVIATAHPAKFPDAVAAATGITPALPSHLADLHDRDERITKIANSLAAVEDFVEGNRNP